MAAYRGLADFREEAKLSTWLWSIAYRQGVNYLRRCRARINLSEGMEAAGADLRAAKPGAAMEEGEQAELIWRAVARLPRLWALATVLFYREDKSIAEIARIMRTPENTVKTYLFRGRKRLKEILGSLWEVKQCG
jgi:RNA polymerase sigma-70 factor (ECF subfamily)